MQYVYKIIKLNYFSKQIKEELQEKNALFYYFNIRLRFL